MIYNKTTTEKKTTTMLRLLFSLFVFNRYIRARATSCCLFVRDQSKTKFHAQMNRGSAKLTTNFSLSNNQSHRYYHRNLHELRLASN